MVGSFPYHPEKGPWNSDIVEAIKNSNKKIQFRSGYYICIGHEEGGDFHSAELINVLLQKEIQGKAQFICTRTISDDYKEKAKDTLEKSNFVYHPNTEGHYRDFGDYIVAHRHEQSVSEDNKPTHQRRYFL